MFAHGSIQTANLSIPDTLFLMVLALVFLGPRRLPELARQAGKLLYEFRKASNDFRLQMEEELRVAEENDRIKRQQAEAAQQAALAPPAAVTEPLSEPLQEPAPADTLPPEDAAFNSIQAPENAAPADSAPVVRPPSTGEIVSAKAPHAVDVENALAEGTPIENAVDKGTEGHA